MSRLTMTLALTLCFTAFPALAQTSTPAPKTEAQIVDDIVRASGIDPAIVSRSKRTQPFKDARDSNMLFWTQAEKNLRFRSMDQLYSGTLIKAGGKIRTLPQGSKLSIPEKDIAAVMDENHMAGLLVVTDGKIRLERYKRGYSQDQKYTSFSMAKSFTSTLLGMAIADGYIKSIDDQMTTYLPELKGSAYDGVSIKQALLMMSGVAWDETYGNPEADVSRMFRDPPPAGEDSTISYVRRLKRAVPPGTKWHYSTGESTLLGVLVKRATGKPLAQYLSEKVWKPYGMERDAFWMVDWSFNEMGGCCISASLRDNARFGMFIMDGAMGKLPKDYLETMTKPLVPIGDKAAYGFQWWNFLKGRYGAMGNGGQLIIIDPATHTVIALNSAQSTVGGDNDPARGERQTAFFERILKLVKK